MNRVLNNLLKGLVDITCRNCKHCHLWNSDYKSLRNDCNWFERTRGGTIRCHCMKWEPLDNLIYLEKKYEEFKS